ncbi:MAG: carboxypeptidase-like regulatory domain-containing protein [Muribaculaceae bacterium]|nr:carboxypeptidase-like regulatory domain-containing protein [Muribaculaceae bacterium]
MKHSYNTSKKMLRPVVCASVAAIMGLGLPVAAQAQTSETTVKEAVAGEKLGGLVIDSSTGQPLPGARVSVVNARAMAMTGDDGRFALNLPDNAVTLRVEAPGFAKILVPVRGEKELTIRLSMPCLLYTKPTQRD